MLSRLAPPIRSLSRLLMTASLQLILGSGCSGCHEEDSVDDMLTTAPDPMMLDHGMPPGEADFDTPDQSQNSPPNTTRPPAREKVVEQCPQGEARCARAPAQEPWPLQGFEVNALRLEYESSSEFDGDEFDDNALYELDSLGNSLGSEPANDLIVSRLEARRLAVAYRLLPAGEGMARLASYPVSAARVDEEVRPAEVTLELDGAQAFDEGSWSFETTEPGSHEAEAGTLSVRGGKLLVPLTLLELELRVPLTSVRLDLTGLEAHGEVPITGTLAGLIPVDALLDAVNADYAEKCGCVQRAGHRYVTYAYDRYLEEEMMCNSAWQSVIEEASCISDEATRLTCQRYAALCDVFSFLSFAIDQNTDTPGADCYGNSSCNAISYGAKITLSPVTLELAE